MFNYEIGMNGRQIRYKYIGLDGNPIKRTPQTDPYGYDEFVLFKSENYDEMDNWIYSDRMLQWDRKAFESAVHKVWPTRSGSQMFYDKKPEDLNKFLNLYFDKDVMLTAVVQGCNISNGYPYWIFAYRDV